ncbi:MAG: UDP-N-acetylmuramoyl-L-alanyl-D-glutamate--2,6-diaminopimelate ligase [Prosthecobacter sp.]|jgi:UDP-N-acetylmuramoyl-L-alanyl-D-glutamate--2,6-diaminopimelate ligase|uniref:UDP-N-acetylmuramoyl-L-alanyl-D-glutamate--2, 6-diaminopimelate ligase n=1 Tax=Prosthecobacter sp. TaxID=1965333 RepID=UPI0019E1192E|nr:UDP-N-acetylmuramoyl-L-alanyl-D-glutamate--2,6-diaminopimelate ligase [Prosthecobacter sp.]MBE2284452.1 UDP-N-acetylmuramoyl-L-alanyl-D-glutamate--2,6-diaminopimelate ligase [Prosthecobacter sp.]
MKLRDIIPHLERPAVSGSLDTEVTGFTYDSRKAGPGIVFVAMRGSNADGHSFIPKAIELGAAAIIAEQAPAEDCATPWVHVRHSRIALAQAAAALNGHPAKVLTIAGVTGTNGKTTTAFLMHHLFNAAQLRSGLLGTVFYDLGGEQHMPATHTTPESLEIQGLLGQMRDNGCRACAMEVSSHALDQDRVFGLPFAAAIFTNLTQDHLDYHGTMEKYFEAKVRLFEMSAALPRSSLIINGDDSWGRKLVDRFQNTGRVTRFGFGVHNEFRAINVRYDFTGTTFELEARGRSFLVRTPLIGDFNVYNTLGALAAAHGVGLNLREAIRHMQNAPQVPGRLERVSENTRFHVFVDYAHTPDGIVNALKTVRALRPRRIITVFGCGGDRDRMKRPKMAAAAEEGSDICVLTSDNPRTEDPEQILNDAKAGFARPKGHAIIPDRREAIRVAFEGAREGDIVVIAGKGHEDYQDIKGKKHPFDDRKVARQLLHDLKAARAQEREEKAAEREAQRGGFGRPPRFDR